MALGDELKLTDEQIAGYYRDFWARTISDADFSKSDIEFASLQIDPKDIEGKEVLDAGCGIGSWAIAMARQGASTVTAVDLSSEAIELARNASVHAGVSLNLRSGDIMTLDEFADGSFDTIVSIEAVHCTPDP